MNQSNPTSSDQNPLGMSKPSDFSRGRSNSAAAGVGSFEYHTFQGNKILGSLDSVSSSTGCRDGNDSFSTQERSEEFSSQCQQHEKNQKEQYQHPCMLNQQSSLFLRPTRNNNIIGNLPSSQAANTINSNRQFTSSSLNSSRDVGQPHFELKSKYQEQLKQQSFQQKSSRLGFDVQSSIQNNGLFESSARLPFSTLTDNSKNTSTNIPASSQNNFEPSKNPPFQSLLQSSLKGKENDAFKQPNYSNFVPSASNKLFEFNPINYSNDSSNTGFNSTLNTNYLGQTNNIHPFNNKNSNYINNNPISSQDSNNNIQWRRMISESNGISSNQNNNQFCNMTGSIGRKQPIFNQTTSSLVSNVSQLSNQHSIGQTHQNNINDLFVSRKMSFDSTSSKYNNKPADMSEILNQNINNRTTEYKNYRNLSLDGSKQKSSSSMLQNNQCEPVINSVKVTPNGYFNSNNTNQNHPYFSSQQQQNPQQRLPKPPNNTQNINSYIGSSGQKAKQLNEQSNISSINRSSDQNQTLLSCHKISDVLKKKQNINIPPDILSYDQDQFPQQVFFLLSEEDKNISSFRERIEREKSKINKDIDHAKKEIDNLLEDLKMEMTQGIDEHFKQLMDIYKAFKGQVIEFKSVKSDLPPFQMPQNASLSSISGKSSSSQNGSSSNAKLIEELQDMRYKAHMSRLYQYIGEIQKSTLAKIQGSSQNLLKLLSNSNQLYNSEGSQQQLTEIKNAFALSLSARFDPLSSFVRAVQIDTPEVIGQINSNSQGSIMNSNNNSQLQSTQQCISLDYNQIFSKDIQALQTDQISLQQQQITLNQQQTLWGQKQQEKSILNQQIQSHNFFSDSSPMQNNKNSNQPQLGLELDNISNSLLKQQLLKQQQQFSQSRQLFQLPKSQELQQQQFQQQDKFNQLMMMQELEQQGQFEQSQQLFNFHPTERPSFGFQQDCLYGGEEQQQQELQIYNQPFALKPSSYAQGQAKNYLPGDPSVQSSFKLQYTSPTELRQFSQPFAIQHGEDEEVAEQQINLKENQL